MPATSPSFPFGQLLASTSALALVFAGALAIPTTAAETIIANGVTVAQQTLTPGDVLTVQAGGTVVDANEAVLSTVVGPITVNNMGLIQSTTDVGVASEPGSDLVIDNGTAGVIKGTTGVVAANTGLMTGSLTLNNSGLITGSVNEGVSTSLLKSLFNTQSGVIFGNSSGIYANYITEFENYGRIEGLQNGILVQGSTSITLGTMKNSGFIVGGTGNGIYSDDIIGYLDNSGTITGGAAGVSTYAIEKLVNSGYITGGTNGVDADGNNWGIITSLVNSGTITGTTDSGVFGNTITSLTNTTTGKITGGKNGVLAAVVDIGSLDNAGIIQGGDYGVYSMFDIFTVNSIGHIQSLTNSGNIVGGVGGVFADEDITTLMNSGNIVGGTDGVHAVGKVMTLANTGTIAGTGQYGIFGDIVSDIGNDGTITGGSTAIHADGSIGKVTNGSNGRIDGVNFGIETDVIGAITNAGLITGGTRGIFADSSIASIANSGTISGFGSASDEGAIITNGVLGSVTNSGMIRALDPTHLAIFEGNGGGDTTLNLNAGSILIGHVDIHNGNDTLNVGPGLNLELTFDDSVPETINTGNNPYVVIGNKVYVADMSAYAATHLMTADLTGALSDTLGSVLNQDADEKGVDGATNVWLHGIGGLGNQVAPGGGTTLESRFGGFAAGADFGTDVETRFGALVGAARGGVETSDGALNTGFVGLYGAGQLDDVAVRGQVVAGYGWLSDWDRIIADNTVATGLKTVTGTGDSYFVSPGITFTKPWATPELLFESILSLNYTGVYANGLTENYPGGVTLSGGTTHILDAKALFSVPLLQNTDLGVVTGDVHIGAAGRVVVTPDQLGTLAGTPVSFSQGGTTANLGTVVGWAAALKLDGGATLATDLNVTLRTDRSSSLTGNVGFKANF